MDVKDYLSRVSLKVPQGQVEAARVELWRLLDDAKKASVPASPQAMNRLYRYPVPRLSPDGSCSLAGELESEPYELTAALGGRSVAATLSLIVLDTLVRGVASQAGVDWLGVYQQRTLPAGPALVKLVAHGVPSRAEYPLTEAFAAKSNNVAVARSGTARLINDVSAHVAAGGAYYECDPRVKAEACLPLLDARGRVVGILDAESVEANRFGGEVMGWMVALALEVVDQLPPGGLVS